MPHSWKVISDNLILKRKAIYEKLYQHIIQRSNLLGRNVTRISPELGQQIPLLEVIMELFVIQLVAVAALVLSYISQELL